MRGLKTETDPREAALGIVVGVEPESKEVGAERGQHRPEEHERPLQRVEKRHMGDGSERGEPHPEEEQNSKMLQEQKRQVRAVER